MQINVKHQVKYPHLVWAVAALKSNGDRVSVSGVNSVLKTTFENHGSSIEAFVVEPDDLQYVAAAEEYVAKKWPESKANYESESEGPSVENVGQ